MLLSPVLQSPCDDMSVPEVSNCGLCCVLIGFYKLSDPLTFLTVPYDPLLGQGHFSDMCPDMSVFLLPYLLLDHFSLCPFNTQQQSVNQHHSFVIYRERAFLCDVCLMEFQIAFVLSLSWCQMNVLHSTLCSSNKLYKLLSNKRFIGMIGCIFMKCPLKSLFYLFTYYLVLLTSCTIIASCTAPFQVNNKTQDENFDSLVFFHQFVRFLIFVVFVWA